MNEDKSSRYHRLRRRASVASTILGVLLLMALVGTGASAALRDTAASLAGGSFLLTLCCYVVILALINEAFSVPLAFYQGVTLERRYGLSTQTTARWWLDHLKAGLVALVFALVAAVFVFPSVRWDSQRWWMVVPGPLTGFLPGLVELGPGLLLAL